MGNPNDPYAPLGETPQQREQRERQNQDYSDAWNRHIKETSKPSNSGFGGSSGGSGAQKLVCNQLYKTGYISQSQFLDSMRDFRGRLTPTHLRGYHVWAVPTVRLMRRSETISKFVAKLFEKRMVYVASKYDSAVVAPLSVRMFCAAGEKVSLLIGLVAKSDNHWKKVYDVKNQPAQIS